MFKDVVKAIAATATFAALPSVAHAGTSTATANVSMQVGGQCAVTGANVHLGSFKTTDTWATVGDKHGYNLIGFTSGTVGTESLNFGSVTCDPSLPWTLSIKGTSAAIGATGAIKMTLNGKVAILYPAIKRIGAFTLSDSSSSLPGTGVQIWQTSAWGNGTGAPQDILGNVTLMFGLLGSSASPSTVLGSVGSASDTLTYTLTF